jgi:hypothetical protein
MMANHHTLDDWPFFYEPERDKGEPSEYSWGTGLTPRHARHAAPDDGGLYGGMSPGIAPDRQGQRYGYAGRQIRS